MSGDERAGTRRTRRARTAARSDASSPGNKSGKSGAPRGTSRGKKGSDAAPPLPDRDAILEFIRTSETKVGKREIARAFGIRGADKIALKALIRELADEGLIAGNRRHMRGTGTLPPVTVLEIVAQDDDGEYVCRPARGDDGEGVTPQGVIVDGPRRGESPAGIGDRVLARLTPISEPDPGGYAFTAEIIKKLPRDDRQLLGVFRTASDDRSRDAGFIEPIDRRNLKTFLVAKADQDEARDGDLVRFTLTGNRRLGPPRARVATVLGNPDDQRQISLIAVHAHGIPETFSPAVIAALDELPPLDLSARDDLRDIPLLTIDPADARDHDDAVHARSDDDAANPGGWVVTVAIADVAHYVRPDTALDRAALERANSVYFPDRVVPMLPEKISNDLCSLRADVERPCLAMRMVFDATGKRRSFRVLRGVMRSRARLSYQQAQSAIDGEPDADTAPLLDDILRPLWSAYRTLAGARDTRAPLDLDLPERRITIGEDGRVAGISVPPRLEAHRLIEEFMIQANVAAAEALEARRSPLVFRVHEPPAPEKLEALRDFLETLEINVPKGGSLRPGHFNRILAQVKGSPHDQLVNEVILRAQSQAVYAPENLGHFGLNLRRYAHFTSPIRRYADLIVHRALISAYKLGPDGLAPGTADMLSEIATTISERERRAMAAERETIDRLVAAHLADRIGATFTARISGVTRSGLFVRLDETGADGFVPASSIGDDYYVFDETLRAMIGSRRGAGYQLGDAVEVELVEAAPTAGALRFDMLSDGRPIGGAASGRQGRRPGRHVRGPRGRGAPGPKRVRRKRR